jgi:hypothetical protein
MSDPKGETSDAIEEVAAAADAPKIDVEQGVEKEHACDNAEVPDVKGNDAGESSAKDNDEAAVGGGDEDPAAGIEEVKEHDGNNAGVTDVKGGDAEESAANDDDNAAVVGSDEEAPPVDIEEINVEEPRAVAFSDSTKEERSTLLASSGLASALADDLPFESHFTVRIPTSTLQYRGSLLRVIDTDDDQIILREVEDEGKKKVLVKRVSLETMSQKVLRIGYTLVTILFCGFLFVFCFEVLLLLIIATQVYSTSRAGELGQINGITLLSTLLAFPMMLYSMSSLMAMGSGKKLCVWLVSVFIKLTCCASFYSICYGYLAGWHFISVEQKRDAIHVRISGGSFLHTHDLPFYSVSRGLENDFWCMVRVGKLITLICWYHNSGINR